MAGAPPQLVNSVDHLRQLIAQAQPGERLFVEIAPNISFEDARMLWEAASLEEGGHEVFNPDMLRSKMEAADFIHLKIRELERSRDYLNGRIGCMRSWVNMMTRDLEAGGPHIPAGFEGVLMLGPQVYLDLNRIGTVLDFEEHRREILDAFLLDLRVGPGKSDIEYYMQPAAQWREIQDQRSLKKINIAFLEIKIEGLMLLRNHICSGIKYMKKLNRERLYMGCGDADFSSFRDISIGDDMEIDD